MFIVMILATLWLKRQDILNESHTAPISKLVTDLVYPALVFSQIALAQISFELLTAAFSIICSLSLAMLSIWLFGSQFLQLANPQLCAFILAGTFGSATLIGTPLLQTVYRDQPELVGQGLVIAQFSESLLFNTLGIFVAIHLGAKKHQTHLFEQIKTFIFSKPMVALFLGLAWQALGIPNDGYIQRTLFGGLTMIGSSLPFLAAIITGLAFTWKGVNNTWKILAAAAFLQLALEPILSDSFVQYFELPENTRQVAFLLSCLPASPLAVVLCSRYGGDTQLASTLILFTSLLAAVTLPVATFFA